MATALKSHPEWMEELRFESVQGSLHAHRRAKRMRMLFILCLVVLTVARLGFPETTSEVVSTPFLMGMIFFLSFFTFTAEWATRRQYADCLERYESLAQDSL